jgi:hypothetical protein
MSEAIAELCNRREFMAGSASAAALAALPAAVRAAVAVMQADKAAVLA